MGFSNDATCVVSESFVYNYMQNLAVVRVYRKSYHDSDNSKITNIIFMAVSHILRQQQGFASNGIQLTQTTESFE